MGVPGRTAVVWASGWGAQAGQVRALEPELREQMARLFPEGAAV